jgi:hypothetical protein
MLATPSAGCHIVIERWRVVVLLDQLDLQVTRIRNGEAHIDTRCLALVLEARERHVPSERLGAGP